MIDLNFINPDEQVDIRREKYIIMLRDVLVLGLVTTIIVTIVILFGRLVMQETISDITDSSSSVKVPVSELSGRVKDINKQLSRIDGVQEYYRAWSLALTELISLVPRGNRLNLLVLQVDQGIVTLKGFSNTREDLLHLKQRFEESETVKSVDMPISNLLNKEDILFEMDIVLDYGTSTEK